MLTNEREVRIALLSVLATILAASGDWGCALFVVVMMLPWKPLYAVGCYLAQPLVDWRTRKVHGRQDQGIAQIERELDVLLRDVRADAPPLRLPRSEMKEFEPVQAAKSGLPMHTPLPRALPTPEHLAAILAIPPVIQSHLKKLPQGLFQNMDLEVRDVKFHGDIADAEVRFKSSNVSGLIVHQRYRLRKAGDDWQVESRLPAEGDSYPVQGVASAGRMEMSPS